MYGLSVEVLNEAKEIKRKVEGEGIEGIMAPIYACTLKEVDDMRGRRGEDSEGIEMG